ncbi:aldolase/citrate lyase family protein [Muricoccus radiodurans]|uniref:aldolase/citrate lyase family protein n=1 Tax=Muricoccus radiodurans TaxID=2231721 RepID=UPI003CF158E7
MRFENRLRARMAAGEVALVATVALGRTGDTARLLAVAGFDVMVIDREHNLIPEEACAEMLMAALETGITPLVRLPDAAPGPIGQALSAGALGVVIPRVEDAVTAEAVVRAATFPPGGRRPVPPVFPHFRRVPVGQAEATARLAAETAVVVIIETAAAVAAADAIAAVPGVDVLFLGASDLMADLGTPGAKESPALWQAAEAVVAACRRHGKVPGMGGIPDEAAMARAAGMGVRYISAAHDATLLQAAATERVRKLRGGS